ncbi:hypothetical protein WR25_10188 [Diploscapter pachys]|uniref:Uncharacterized protein n=1 Tax=Diploscapter pachys TaxID=2018661 RepID=A0A2A2KM45_9BILA|nr:hypothetical protein WR25_10188 [Diploscapter pachys]
MVSIGIDLGTTYSCVAIIENGRPVAIHNDDGKNIIPSVVAFGEKETLVGNSALDYNTDLSNILYDSKRLIGWHILYDLPNANDRQLWTFDVDTRNNCAGYVLNKGKSNERFILPEEVSAEILKSLKDQAEKYTRQKVTKAVVTVPASFQEGQIAATKRAIEMAGLKLKDLLQEPTAAILAYTAKYKLGRSKIMIFDFGGGTLDICIAQINPDGYELKAATGDPHLGGQDFDSQIMKYVLDEFRETSDYDIYKKPKLVKRLRTECRKAKEFLSASKDSVNIHLDINDDVAINVQLSREKFNELCSDLFDRAMTKLLLLEPLLLRIVQRFHQNIFEKIPENFDMGMELQKD